MKKSIFFIVLFMFALIFILHATDNFETWRQRETGNYQAYRAADLAAWQAYQEETELGHKLFRDENARTLERFKNVGISEVQLVEVTQRFEEKVDFVAEPQKQEVVIKVDTSAKREFEREVMPELAATHTVTPTVKADVTEYAITPKPASTRSSDQNDARSESATHSTYRAPLDRMEVTSVFGIRTHPITRKKTMHNGIDLRGNRGTPVYSVAPGTVVKAATGHNGGFGNVVEIRHENGAVTLYAHLDTITCKQGDRVTNNQIGTVGSTGASTGNHLHMGYIVNTKWTNPQSIPMQARG